jgi:uncharacterized membrane protein
VFILVGLFMLWHAAHHQHLYWSTKLLVGSLLLGFGLFNTVEGVIDHHWLGIHHVNETIPSSQWPAWDIAFTTWGVAMILGGGMLLQSGRRETRR